jgi:hypothetical protein
MALLAAWWMWRSRRSPSGGNRNAEAIDTLAGWPPGATRLLTKSEQEAYDLLRTALPTNMVLAQVPLHRFIKVPARNSYSEWMRRVGRQHVDLVVCDRHSQVLAAVEVVTEDPAPGWQRHGFRSMCGALLPCPRLMRLGKQSCQAHRRLTSSPPRDTCRRAALLCPCQRWPAWTWKSSGTSRLACASRLRPLGSMTSTPCRRRLPLACAGRLTRAPAFRVRFAPTASCAPWQVPLR